MSKQQNESSDRIWLVGQVAFKHPRNGGVEYVRVVTAAASSPAPAEPPKSLLRDPIQVRVLPPPIVTRDGVPCEDQPAALEEFKQRCRASLDDKEAGCVHGVPVCEECASTPSPSETTIGREARTCSDCGHGFGVDLRGRCRTVLRDAGGSLVNCGCKCRLAAASAEPACGYCASPDHFRATVELPHNEGRWHRSTGGGYYRCTAPAPAQPEGEQETNR